MNSNRKAKVRELLELSPYMLPKQAYEAVKGIKGRRKTDKDKK